jgi:translocation protein SEC63
MILYSENVRPLAAYCNSRSNLVIFLEQQEVVLQTPLLLNALLNVAVARTWLLPTLTIMRLHAAFTQALPPNASEHLRLTQLPGLSAEDLQEIAPKAKSLTDVLRSLEEKADPRATDVKKAIERWGRVDLVSASFKVIGERIVTPSSIIYLLVKLRIAPPRAETAEKRELSVDETKKAVREEEEADETFLASRLDAEELPEANDGGAAHAPFWPGVSIFAILSNAWLLLLPRFSFADQEAFVVDRAGR